MKSCVTVVIDNSFNFSKQFLRAYYRYFSDTLFVYDNNNFEKNPAAPKEAELYCKNSKVKIFRLKPVPVSYGSALDLLKLELLKEGYDVMIQLQFPIFITGNKWREVLEREIAAGTSVAYCGKRACGIPYTNIMAWDLTRVTKSFRPVRKTSDLMSPQYRRVIDRDVEKTEFNSFYSDQTWDSCLAAWFSLACTSRVVPLKLEELSGLSYKKNSNLSLENSYVRPTTTPASHDEFSDGIFPNLDSFKP